MQDREPQLDVDVSWEGVVAKVTVTGELDITTASILCQHLLDVRAQRPERLVLDLAGLGSSMSSARGRWMRPARCCKPNAR